MRLSVACEVLICSRNGLGVCGLGVECLGFGLGPTRSIYIYIYIYTRLPRSFYLEAKNRKTRGQPSVAWSFKRHLAPVCAIMFHAVNSIRHLAELLSSHMSCYFRTSRLSGSPPTHGLSQARETAHLNLSKPRRVERGHSSRPLARRFAFAVRCFRQQDLMLGVITCEPAG